MLIIAHTYMYIHMYMYEDLSIHSPYLMFNFLQHSDENLRSLTIETRARLLAKFLFPILNLVLDAGDACD